MVQRVKKVLKKTTTKLYSIRINLLVINNTIMALAIVERAKELTLPVVALLALYAFLGVFTVALINIAPHW